MEFTIRPLTANIGAEITGLDLRYPIDVYYHGAVARSLA